MVLDPPMAGGCFAARVPVAEDQALAGLRWYASGGAVFERILVGSGAGILPPVYQEAVSVVEDVPGEFEGWTEVSFGEPVASLSGSLYLIFEYPDGIPVDGDGPGIGYRATDQMHIAYVSDDGENWVKLTADYEILVEPVYSGRDASVIALRAVTPQILLPISPPDLPHSA